MQSSNDKAMHWNCMSIMYLLVIIHINNQFTLYMYMVNGVSHFFWEIILFGMLEKIKAFFLRWLQWGRSNWSNKLNITISRSMVDIDTLIQCWYCETVTFFNFKKYGRNIFLKFWTTNVDILFINSMIMINK